MRKTGVSLQIIEFMFHALSLNTYLPLTALTCTLFHTYQIYVSPINAEIVSPRKKGFIYVSTYGYTYVCILFYYTFMAIGSSHL